MADYLFVLGRDYELSILEIISYFNARNIEFEIKEFSKEIAVLSLQKINFEKIIKDLGGTVKIGKIIAKDLNFEIDFLLNNKVNYGISTYSKNNLKEKLKVYLKNKFKQEKIKAMYKKGETKQLMPRDLKNIVDFLIYKDYIGITIAVSNTKEYKERDKRPYNDFMKNTSIRLAKIMINLSGAKENDSLLDPFCGTGVILQEALLMNINVFGVDIDKSSVNASKKNCEWLAKKYNIKTNYSVLEGDSTKLNKFFNKKVDVVVTEPYLGPYIKKSLSFEEAKKIIKELERIYTNFLISLKNIVKKNVVLIVPTIVLSNGKEVRLTMQVILNKSGFSLINFSLFKMPIPYGVNRGKIKREVYIIKSG